MIESHIIRKITQISLNSEHKFGFIAKYVINNAKKVSGLTIKELAEVTFCSPATINRFVSSIGLDGYKEFIYVLRYYNNTYMNKKVVDEEMDEKNILESHFARTTNNLTKTKDALLMQQNIVKKIIENIEKANKINIFSVGGTFNSAKDFADKLERLGFVVTSSNDYHNGYYIAKQTGPKDLAVFISYSGETEDLIKLAKLCHKHHAPVLLVTKQANNSLSSLATYKLEIVSDEPIKRAYSTTSRLAILFALDFIYLTLINSNFEKYRNVLNQTTLEKF